MYSFALPSSKVQANCAVENSNKPTTTHSVYFIPKNRDKQSLPQKNYYAKKNKIHFLLQNKIVFCKFAPYNVDSHYINIVNN